jgi:DNA repair exonuclease SbcCD ATPase subunit
VLRELSVQNLALIEDVQVELEGGYCAWTGETGAGKSLLLTALSLVLGGKASAELIRSGKAEARAAAVFEVADPRLRAEVEAILGGALDDEAQSSSWGLAGGTSTASTRATRCWSRTSSARCWTPTGGWAKSSRPTARRGRRTARCAGSGRS